MSEQITTQISFRGQVIDAIFFRCAGQAFVMAAVPADGLPATLHPSEEQEVVVLDSGVGDRPEPISAETKARIKARLGGII